MAKLKTGRHTSAIKQNRKSKKLEASNTAQRSKIRTLSKKIEAAAAQKDVKTATSLIRTAFSEWDKAAKKNIIHKNAAANQKARLSKIVANITAQS